MADTDDLISLARRHIPIASLDPSQPLPPHASIHGVITLLWPFSSSTQSLSLLLAEPDFRLRSNRGQVRIQIGGAAARTITASQIGIGDVVDLDLEGGKWTELASNVKTPGRSVEGEISFKRKLNLKIHKDGGLPTDLHVDAPASPPPQENVTPARPLPPPRIESPLEQEKSHTHSSPFRLSLDLHTGGYDPFADDYELEERPRKRLRTSGLWRYVRQSESPPADIAPSLEPQVSGGLGGAQLDGTFDLPPQVVPNPASIFTQDAQVPAEDIKGSKTVQADPPSQEEPLTLAPEQQMLRSTPSDDRAIPADLPRIETHVQDDVPVSQPTTARPSTPASPRLRPVQSAVLENVSPLAPLKQPAVEFEPADIVSCQVKDDVTDVGASSLTPVRPADSPTTGSVRQSVQLPGQGEEVLDVDQGLVPKVQEPEDDGEAEIEPKELPQPHRYEEKPKYVDRIIQDTYESQANWSISMDDDPSPTFSHSEEAQSPKVSQSHISEPAEAAEGTEVLEKSSSPMAGASFSQDVAGEPDVLQAPGKSNVVAVSEQPLPLEYQELERPSIPARALEDTVMTSTTTGRETESTPLPRSQPTQEPQTSSPLRTLDRTPTPPTQLQPQPSRRKPKEGVIIDLSSGEDDDDDDREGKAAQQESERESITEEEASVTPQPSSIPPPRNQNNFFIDRLVHSQPSLSLNDFGSTQRSIQSIWTDKTLVANSESEGTDFDLPSDRAGSATPHASRASSATPRPVDEAVDSLPSSASKDGGLGPTELPAFNRSPDPDPAKDASRRRFPDTASLVHRPSSAISPLRSPNQTLKESEHFLTTARDTTPETVQSMSPKPEVIDSISPVKDKSPVRRSRRLQSLSPQVDRKPPSETSSRRRSGRSTSTRPATIDEENTVGGTHSELPQQHHAVVIDPIAEHGPLDVEVHNDSVSQMSEGNNDEYVEVETMSSQEAPESEVQKVSQERVSHVVAEDDDGYDLYKKPSPTSAQLASSPQAVHAPPSTERDQPSLRFEQITPEPSQREPTAQVEQPLTAGHRVDQILDARLPPTPAPSGIPADMVVDKDTEKVQPKSTRETVPELDTEAPDAQTSKDNAQLAKPEVVPVVEDLTVEDKMQDHQTPRKRVSEIPSALSAWFTSSVKSSRTLTRARKPSSKPSSQRLQSLGPTAQTKKPASVGFDFAPTPFPAVELTNGHVVVGSDISRPVVNGNIEPKDGLRTSLSYYTPLSDLPSHLNSVSQTPQNTIDIIAVVASLTAKPERAKSGPKDYFTLLHVMDKSIQPDKVQVQIFRPFRYSLPVAGVGDIIVLRNFVVKSRLRKCYLLSGESSGWLVWSGQDEQCRGPPVEVGEQERQKASELRAWMSAVV